MENNNQNLTFFNDSIHSFEIEPEISNEYEKKMDERIELNIQEKNKRGRPYRFNNSPGDIEDDCIQIENCNLFYNPQQFGLTADVPQDDLLYYLNHCNEEKECYRCGKLKKKWNCFIINHSYVCLDCTTKEDKNNLMTWTKTTKGDKKALNTAEGRLCVRLTHICPWWCYISEKNEKRLKNKARQLKISKNCLFCRLYKKYELKIKIK